MKDERGREGAEHCPVELSPIPQGKSLPFLERIQVLAPSITPITINQYTNN